MINILYVCLGNICRSPIAEGTMRQLVENQNLSAKIYVDSAGTAGYHIGSPPDSRTVKNAENNGLILQHSCRQLTVTDFGKYQYIVAMDQSNLANINSLSLRHYGYQQPEHSCFLLRSYDNPSQPAASVPDPYYGSAADFEAVYQIVHRCNQNFLDWLIKAHNL
jgi:protein-tyrosine phosphatase